MFRIFLLISVLAVAFAIDSEAYARSFLRHTLSGSVVTNPKEVKDAGFDNALVQAIFYAEDKCEDKKAFYFQRIDGGICQKLDTDGDQAPKSQMFGCTSSDYSDSSAVFDINVVQFLSDDCTGEPLQYVIRKEDPTACTATDNDDGSPYETSVRMKCVTNGEMTLETGAYMTGYFGGNDKTCLDTPKLLQGVLAGRCMKGTQTNENGVVVPSNTSTTISCVDSMTSQYNINLFAGTECAGEAMTFTEKVAFPDCTASKTSSGAAVNMKQECKNPNN